MLLDEQDVQHQETQASGEVEQERDGECFKKRHAIEIKKIIGSSNDLSQFDEVRYRLKTTKTITSEPPISDSFISYNWQYNEENIYFGTNSSC